MAQNQEQGTRSEDRPKDGGQQSRGSSQASESDRRSQPSIRLQERGREAYREAQQLASTLEQAVDEIGQFLRTQTERRPYVSIATATGIGYVLGGGVPARLTGFLFGLGGRLAVEMFLRELIGDATASRAAERERGDS